MDHLKQLDDVLKFLHNDELSSVVYSKIMMKFRKLPKGYLRLILDRLCQDEYIIKKGEVSEWAITHKGLIFISSSGYRRKAKADQISNILGRLQYWSLVVAAISASLYYSYELLKIVYSAFFASQPSI